MATRLTTVLVKEDSNPKTVLRPNRTALRVEAVALPLRGGKRPELGQIGLLAGMHSASSATQ